MTPEQEAHRSSLIHSFSLRLSKKYEDGVKEHGGNLWEKSVIELLNESLQENIDQFTYISTARDNYLEELGLCTHEEQIRSCTLCHNKGIKCEL